MDDDRIGDQREEVNQEEPPLQDLVDRIRQEDSDSGPTGPAGLDESADDFQHVFTREQSEEVDIDAVWSTLESDWPREGDLGDSGNSDAEHIVEKRWYCEQCEYFSEPPEVHCNHDGTSIEEFIGTEKVRVRNCPVVTERQALGQYHGEESP